MIKFIKETLIIISAMMIIFFTIVGISHFLEKQEVECPVCETCEECECECDCNYDFACVALDHCPETPKTYKQELIETQTLLENCQILNKKFRPLTYVMMNTFGTWKYNTKDYNCVDFSKKFQMELKKVGIESTVIYGDNLTTTNKIKHAWNCVWVEPINGNFVKPEDGYKIIDLWDNYENTNN